MKNTKIEKTILYKWIGQIILSLFWCILFGISYGLNKIESTRVSDAITIPSVVCLCLNGLSILFRFGFLESTTVSFRKWYINRPSEVRRRKEESQEPLVNYSIEDLRKKRRNNDYWALTIMSVIYIIGILVGVFI